MNIPIVIGVTGHRDLREPDIPKLRELVRAELQKLKDAYPHSPPVMLNSLAAGADLLCAEIAAELGIMVVCPLPMAVDEYRHDFEEVDHVRFDAMLRKAKDVFVAPATEKATIAMTRDFQYRQAGIYVASHSHVLLALWDGFPAKPDGCGTAEVVGFMLNKSYEDGCGCFRATNDGAVIHILTPRKSSDKDLTVSTELIENEPGCLREVLRMTDDFNTDAQAERVQTQSKDTLIPMECLESCGNTMKSLHALYAKADSLSIRFQAKYLFAMKCFSIFGVLLVLSFLLYDELESNIFLLCYGLLIVLYVFAFILVRRSKYHMKYLQYRVLSETLRVQFYLVAAGTDENIGSAFTWTQKQDSTWIKEAVSALLIGAPDNPDISYEVIKEKWIDGQLAYHRKAYRRDWGKHRISERTARWMLIFSVSLFAVVLVLELVSAVMTQLVFTKPLPAFFMQHSGQELTMRSLLKIILGGISAMTVFLSNYYGKLSFERKSIDHEKMALLYAAAKEQFESGKIQKAQLFRELAREEIIENGNWFSYCRESTPSFNV